MPEPKVPKNRLHLDIQASGGPHVPLAARQDRVIQAAERLISLGAILFEYWDETEIDHYAALMQDPEGDEFDINQPRKPW